MIDTTPGGATRPGHPSTHGHHINHYTCGRGDHAVCHGFSGGYDTYTCGCCCHDLDRDPQTVTDADRAWINRVHQPARANTTHQENPE